MITFTGIHKRFGGLTVLDGVSLELCPGAVTALVGPNGSGKTTLIKIALGLARADSGCVTLDGKMADTAGAYRSEIGYMPQIARLPENLRVRDLIELMASLRPGTERDTELIDEFRLEREFEKPLGTLSGGTRQKVTAAIAFLFRPRILVLDEPTAGLDPVSSGVLKRKIGAARAEGHTVLITSHILAELEEIADDIAYLCEGSLQFAGSIVSLLGRTGQPRLEPAIASLIEWEHTRPRPPVAREHRGASIAAALTLVR